jgi:hypothetical protein
VSRERFALTYMAVDIAAILSAAIVFFVAELFTLAAVGFANAIAIDGTIVPSVLVGLGFSLAFYGVSRALGTAFGRGGTIAGVSWPIGFILAGLASAPFPYVLHDIIVGLNFLNPIAYLTSVASGQSSTVLPVSFEWRLACEWILALATMAASVVIWKRLED